MLFNAYEFLFLFLPLTLAGYFWVARRGHEPAIVWLVLASLFFYAWWRPVYLVLLLVSMLANFGLGSLLDQAHRQGRQQAGKAWPIAGVVFNLGLLGYFKYANFTVSSLNALAGTDFHLDTIILPLAISFFTFQSLIQTKTQDNHVTILCYSYSF